jgi:hypothetical protein
MRRNGEEEEVMSEVGLEWEVESTRPAISHVVTRLVTKQRISRSNPTSFDVVKPLLHFFLLFHQPQRREVFMLPQGLTGLL